MEFSPKECIPKSGVQGYLDPASNSRMIGDSRPGAFRMRRPVSHASVLKRTGYRIPLEVLAKGNYRRILEVSFIS